MTYTLFPRLSQLSAENGGAAILNHGWIHPERNLDTSVLILGWKNRVELEEDGEPVSIEPGRLTLLTAGKTHRGLRRLEDSASYYWIHFKCAANPITMKTDDVGPILGNRSVAMTRLNDAILLPREIPVSDSRAFHQFFHEILFEQEHPSFTALKYQLMFRMMMVELNEYVLKRHEASPFAAVREGLINLMIQTIAEKFTDGNFSVKDLASSMGYNSDYLCRVFKFVMNISLRDYIIDRRLQYAERRLTDSLDTVEKIAFDSGFSTVRNFIRQFKLRKGMTPSAMRQRHRTMHITSV